MARPGDRDTLRVRTLIMKAPPLRERLDLNETILEVIDLARAEAGKNDISLTTRLAQDLPFTRGDRVQLQQVILNLIINAIEAMAETSEEPRELHITTGESDWDGVIVAVRDSGPGVAPANLKRVFDASIRPSPRVWGSVCRSAVRSSTLTGDACGRAPTCRGAPSFNFTYQETEQGTRCDERALGPSSLGTGLLSRCYVSLRASTSAVSVRWK